MDDHLGRIAYNAYGHNRDWKAYNDEAMPQWADLPEKIRIAWCAATAAVVRALVDD